MPDKLLIIGGFEPKGEVGILRDFSIAQQLSVASINLISSLTIQNQTDQVATTKFEAEFFQHCLNSIDLNEVYAIKVGLIINTGHLASLENFLRQAKQLHNLLIIIDPVLQSSTGYNFLNKQEDLDLFLDILKLADVLTPNYHEAEILYQNLLQQKFIGDMSHLIKALSDKLNINIILKGGHNPDASLNDNLDASTISDHLCFLDKASKSQTLEQISNTKILSSTGELTSIRGSGCIYATSLACFFIINKSGLSRINLLAAAQLAQSVVIKNLQKSNVIQTSCNN